jgi:O-antigen ligase
MIHFFEEKHIFSPVRNNNSRQSLFLFLAAIALALLTVIIAEFLGELPALLSLILIFFLTISVINYKAGILFAIILLPLTATQHIPRELFGVKGLNPLNATLALSIVSLIIAKSLQHGKILIPMWPRYFLIYLGLMVLASFYGASHASSIPPYYLILKVNDFNSAGGYLRDILAKPLIILFTGFMLSVAIANTDKPRRYLIPFFFSSITLPVIVIGYVLVSGVSLSVLASSEHRGFLSALGIHANELGFMFNMAFALALFCFFSVENSWAKWALGIITLILLTAIMLTFSRGAFLGVLAVTGYFLFTRRKFRSMLAVFLLVVMSTFVMPQAVVDRALTGVKSGNVNVEDVSAGRVDRIWRPLLPEVLGSPLVGHGMSSILWSDAAIHHEILPVGHPHSAYLGALLDFGILGSIIIFLFFRHMWALFARIGKLHPDPLWRGFFQGGTACILLMLVQGVTDDRFTPTLPQTFLWLTYGIAVGLAARQKKIIHDQNRSRPAGVNGHFKSSKML